MAAGIAIGGQPARAQDATAIQSIQQEIRQLQGELRKLQADVAKRDAALKQAQDQAKAAQQDAAAARASAAAKLPVGLSPAGGPPITSLAVPTTVPAGSAVMTIPPNDKDANGKPFFNSDKPNGRFNLGGVTVSLGGFVDITGYYRSRNENRGTATSFGGLPFAGPTPQGQSSELGLTAQQTRISLRADASISDASKITGYIEADFNNGAGGANSVQTSSYTPRIRQGFGEYSYEPWQMYVLGGQAWSLATPFKQGLDPFQTWQPPTIDTSYVVGYTYLRVPVVRVAKEVGPVWLGLEAAMPQTVFGGTSVAPTGGAITTGYPGAGGLNPQVNYSVNSLPDFVGKAAVDTPYGHYEAFGLLRQFESQISFANTKVSNEFALGGGFGASAYIPIAKYADIEGNILTGHGIGRYGSGGLSDVTFALNGGLKPLYETMGEVGVVGHVTPKFDLWVFGGIDQIGSSFFNKKSGKTTISGGYGNYTFNNTGCFNPNSAGLNCTGNNFEVSEITAGFTWKLLQGRYGTVQTSLQYGYIQRQAYGGVGGAPEANANLVYVNLRYSPFN